MSFLNFGKDKSNTEHFDTAEIKQAAISDTQLNSLNSANLQVPNEINQNLPSLNKEQNFVNPFSTSNENVSNQNLSNIEQNSNYSLNQNSNTDLSLNNSNQIKPLQNPQTIPNNPTNINPNSQNEMQMQNQDLHKLNQNVTQSLQSQESISKEQIKELIDETVEKIIEEKWDSLTEKIDKVLKWKEKKDEEINMLKEDIVNIADGFSKLENKLISKISNYDKNILDVNSEIKALEKVFQKVTPTLINNVNELSKIADDLRGIKKEKKENNEEN